MLEDLLKRLSRIISPGARRGLGQSTEALKATGEGLLPSSSSSSFFFFLLLVLRLRLLLIIILLLRLLLLILILIELSLTFPKFLKPK